MSAIRDNLRKTKYGYFPFKLFYELLSGPERRAHLFIGKSKWSKMLKTWEEDDDSLEASALLEEQKKVLLSHLKAENAVIALQWVLITRLDRKEILLEAGMPYKEDIAEQVTALKNYITKHRSQYENNLIQLEAINRSQTTETQRSFSSDDAIATLNLAGFTINDPDKLTIGQFKAMNRTIQRNGKRAS